MIQPLAGPVPGLPRIMTADLLAGSLIGAPSAERRVSDLRQVFSDDDAARELEGHGNPVVYRVFRFEGEPESSAPELSITKIESGDVGGELFMTHGHDHNRDTGESFLCLSGSGGLVVRHHDRAAWVAMSTGTVIQLPAGWRHRTVNTGPEPFIFLGYYHPPIDVDYTLTATEGLGARVVKQGKTFQVIPSDEVQLLSL